MSNLGVFQWIREGVRRSVLLGFSDAVEELGVAADGTEILHPQLAAALCAVEPKRLSPAPISNESKRERKRLGRSLEQFRGDQPPSSSDKRRD